MVLCVGYLMVDFINNSVNLFIIAGYLKLDITGQ